jgi:hypothetical protein
MQQTQPKTCQTTAKNTQKQSKHTHNTKDFKKLSRYIAIFLFFFLAQTHTIDCTEKVLWLCNERVSIHM